MALSRRSIVLAAVGASAAPFAARVTGVLAAPPAGRVIRIAKLTSGEPPRWDMLNTALRAALHDLGYVDGKNLQLIERVATYPDPRMAQYARDMAESKQSFVGDDRKMSGHFLDRERQQLDQSGAASERLTDPIEHLELLAAGEDEATGRGPLIDERLQIRQERRDPLHLIEDRACAVGAEKTARILGRERSHVGLLEIHVGSVGERQAT